MSLSRRLWCFTLWPRSTSADADNGNPTKLFPSPTLIPSTSPVRDFQVDVEVTASFADAFKAKFSKSKVGDVEGGGNQRKRILKDVSADFPAGTLTAVAEVERYVSTFIPRAQTHPLGQTKHTLQRIPQPTYCYQRLCDINRCVAPIPHRPPDFTLRRSPSTSIIHHFSTVEPASGRGHSRTRFQGLC